MRLLLAVFAVLSLHPGADSSPGALYRQSLGTLSATNRVQLTQRMVDLDRPGVSYRVEVAFVSPHRVRVAGPPGIVLQAGTQVQVGDVACSWGGNRFRGAVCKQVKWGNSFLTVNVVAMMQPRAISAPVYGQMLQAKGSHLLRIPVVGQAVLPCLPGNICPAPVTGTARATLTVDTRTGRPVSFDDTLYESNHAMQRDHITYVYGPSVRVELPHTPRIPCPSGVEPGSWCLAQP